MSNCRPEVMLQWLASHCVGGVQLPWCCCCWGWWAENAWYAGCGGQVVELADLHTGGGQN